MVTYQKPVSIDFSDMSGGTVTVDPALSLRKNQISSSLNAIIRGKNGFQRCPGFTGIKSTAIHDSYYLRGLHLYEQIDGTVNLVDSAADGTVNVVNKSTGALTNVHTPTGAGESWFANAFGKCFVANGTAMSKIESASVGYRVGLAAPTGVAAVAAAGAGLPDGVYQVYAVYGREVGGVQVLYSAGQFIGSVTLGTGSNRVSISNFLDSADPQVNLKTIWMTNAGGAVIYYYGKTAAYADTTLVISATTDRNTSLIYTVECSNNQTPGAFTSLIYHAGRLWGVINNYLYFSLRAGNEYDLERWPSSNYNVYPWAITGLFVLGDHLYLNTPGGVIQQPYGDPSAQYVLKDARWYYKYPRTVDQWGSMMIGVTNNGVRTFDGEKFSTVDLSKDIKPQIDDLQSNATTTILPAGKVIRRSFRTEYQLSYINEEVSTIVNNRTAVLNLDRVMVPDNADYQTPWEFWEHGFAYCVQDKDGVIYKGQAVNNGGNGAGTIYTESATTSADRYIYDPDSTFLTDVTNKEFDVQTRHVLPDSNGFCRWQWINLICQLSSAMSIKLILAEKTWVDVPSLTVVPAISTTEVPLIDDAIIDLAIIPALGEVTISKKITIAKKAKGRIVYLQFTQTADDLNFKVLSCVLNGVVKRTRYT